MCFSNVARSSAWAVTPASTKHSKLLWICLAGLSCSRCLRALLVLDVGNPHHDARSCQSGVPKRLPSRREARRRSLCPNDPSLARGLTSSRSAPSPLPRPPRPAAANPPPGCPSCRGRRGLPTAVVDLELRAGLTLLPAPGVLAREPALPRAPHPPQPSVHPPSPCATPAMSMARHLSFPPLAAHASARRRAPAPSSPLAPSAIVCTPSTRCSKSRIRMFACSPNVMMVAPIALLNHCRGIGRERVICAIGRATDPLAGPLPASCLLGLSPVPASCNRIPNIAFTRSPHAFSRVVAITRPRQGVRARKG